MTSLDDKTREELYHVQSLIDSGLLRSASVSPVTAELVRLIQRFGMSASSPRSPRTPASVSVNQTLPPTVVSSIKLAVIVFFAKDENLEKFDDETVSMSLTILPNQTMEQLKREIDMKQTYRPHLKVYRIENFRTGTKCYLFDSVTVASFGLMDGDKIHVVCLPQKSSESITLESTVYRLDGINSAGSRNDLEVLIAAIHYFLLNKSFICIYEQPNSVPGFAPSLRDLPKETFLPENWNSTSDGIIRILYKHSLKAGKIFQLMCKSSGGNQVLNVVFQEKKGNSLTIDLNITDFYVQNNGVDARNLINLQTLEDMVQTKIHNFISPPLSLQNPNLTSTSSSSYPSYPNLTQSPSTHLPTSYTPNYNNNNNNTNNINHHLYNPSNPISIGSNDLDPFGSIYIGPSSSTASTGNVRIGPYGSNQMGPDHPIFSQPSPSPSYHPVNSNYPYPPFAIPQPRYDPTGPVLGPHTDINNNTERNTEGDPFFYGPDGRPVLGGRGRILPGEPGPDHMRPPTWH